MSKNNLVSVRFDDCTFKKIEELIDHYQIECYNNGFNYASVDRTFVINFAIEKLYRDIIESNEEH